MQSEINKHLLPLAGKPVIAHTLLAFERCPADRQHRARHQRGEPRRVPRHRHGIRHHQSRAHRPRRRNAAGFGLQRPARVRETPTSSSSTTARVPCIAQREIEAVIRDAAAYGARWSRVPAKDTTIRAREGFIETSLDRSTLWQLQTPQAFKTAIIMEAYEAALRDGVQSTDDTGLVTRYRRRGQSHREAATPTSRSPRRRIWSSRRRC